MLSALALLLQTTIPTPPVDHNHFYVTVDKETFKAMRESKWLRSEFADVSEQTHSSGDETWTGLYVYGVGSYVEVFAAGREKPEGKSGLGLLTTAPGGVDDVLYHFRRGPLAAKAERDLMFLGSADKQEPLAHIATFGGQEKTNLSVWLMEYHAEFYRRCGVPVGSSEAAIFAKYRSRSKSPYVGMMGDLRSVSLQPEGDGADLKAALRHFGFVPSSSGDVWKRKASEVVLQAATSSVPKYGVTSARFSLRTKPVRAHTERFGRRSTLRVSPDGTAEWRFR